MTKDEFAYWQSRIQNSSFQWTEDEIFRLNGRGAFYYTGGEDGIYIKIHKDGRLEAGTYEGAFPHIGEACFNVKAQRQCKGYSEAFAAAMEAGGKQFLLDMFSADVVPPPAPAEKPSVVNRIKASREPHRAPIDSEPRDTTLAFEDFVQKCRMLDEACRQWCDFIDEAPERRDGEFFTEFFEDICKQKYEEYLNDPGYREDCNHAAEIYDQNEVGRKDVPDKGKGKAEAEL